MGRPPDGPSPTRRLAEFVAAKKGVDPDELESQLTHFAATRPDCYRALLARERYRVLRAYANQLPIPRFRASHAVPYGRVFRQWMTDGSLVVWVNRGQAIDGEHGGLGLALFQVWNHAKAGGPVEYE